MWPQALILEFDKPISSFHKIVFNFGLCLSVMYEAERLYAGLLSEESTFHPNHAWGPTLHAQGYEEDI